MSLPGNLVPAAMWKYFEEICRVPRVSGHEGMIRQYLLEFARSNNLEAREDSTGNVLITKPASPGMENRKAVVLQSHMDMVGEKAPGSAHDWLKDPVVPVYENGWISARETTLGADDGAGVAAQLAMLTDAGLKAGKIECLFTVDEESGMTGAVNISPGFFTARTLINLDSEDEGILFIGCAGGIETDGTISFSHVPSATDSLAYEISVSGLHGGHSGDEIHKGYGNSIKIITRILLELSDMFDISLSRLEGGNLRNAIPREASAVIVVAKELNGELTDRFSDIQMRLLTDFNNTESDLKITLKEAGHVQQVMKREDSDKLLAALDCCPHGVIAWSKEMEDLVETSTNLASVKFTADNTIRIITTQRSSIDKSKSEVATTVETCLKKAGAAVNVAGSYPGWKPDLSSEILRLTRQSYLKLFGREPLVKAIHAGLECGLLYEKVKGIDMISFGPTIRGAHTTEEKIEVRSAEMFLDLLKDVITGMPDEPQSQS